MREGGRWRAFISIWLVILPTQVLADDESDIRSAYSEYQKTLANFQVSERDLSSVIGLSDFLTRTMRQAYGSESFSPSNASLMTGYGVGLIRGLFLCAYMSPTSNEAIDLVRKGAPATALELLRAMSPTPWVGIESFGPVDVSGDRAKMEFNFKADKGSKSGGPISFTDYIEFQRTDGRWKLDFSSIISMADRNASAVAAGGIMTVDSEGRSPGEVGFNMAYLASVLYTVPRCLGDLLPRDQSGKDVIDAVFRAEAIAVGTPIRAWPDKNADTWWKQ